MIANQTTSAQEEIFFQAAEISDTLQREEFLRLACKSDTLLRQSIDALLADHEQAGRLFQKIGEDFTLDSDTSAGDAGDEFDDAEIGTSIGPYRLVCRLGEGGGGIVYEAEQETPVHRRVALKILKHTLDKRRVMNRFHAERQALELMEHPNVARVLDAGLTRDGRPFFVMELVRGTKITEHCKKHAVQLTERLRLLQQVCSAVQHAHQKGIIHCDLKPSNILVTMTEGIPVPKVIDFGIAKAAAGAPSEWTRQGFHAGTPAYMSPEQLGGSSDVDTRSDIYSLGVVMYELLAGRAPFDSEETSTTGNSPLATGKSPGNSPPPPSQLARLAGTADVDWGADLDCIVMKAIDKDRECRYATIKGLDQDITRYLANEPILARPPSRLYRMRKLVRRNRLATVAIVAGVLCLVGGFTTSSMLYLKAEAAERKQSQLRAEAEEREHVARAAILLLQDKTADADDEIRHMGGMLTQPSLEATNVFRTLATWNALRGDWKAASQRLLALSRVHRFDETDQTDNSTRDLVALAPTLIEAGDIDEYREFEKSLMAQMGRTNNPVAAEQILKICLLLPPSPDLLPKFNSIAAVAEKSLTGVNPTSVGRLAAWRCFAVGLWKYRTGQYDQAIDLLTLAADARPARNETVIRACSLAVRSMAFTKLGRTDAAAADLAEDDSIVDGKFSSALEFDKQGYWNDWLYARILLNESRVR